MTLQNKKTHLLDSDSEQNEISDALDLFDKYGGGENDNSYMATSDTTSRSVTRPRTDNEINLSNQEPEKKWEQEYEGKSFAQSVQSENPTQDTLESQQKESDSPTVSHLKRDTSSAPEAQEVPVSQSKDLPKEEILPKQETLHATAPVKQNHNSVIQGHQKQTQKKSIKPKEVIPSQEIHVDPSKKTIMIVDDDIDTLEMYADVFESANYNVIRASDGLEAMSLIGKHTPHIIFTGIVMPRMDGFSMMEALKQNKRTADIPVVINSHLGRDTDKDKAESLGARDFIIRGFTQPREVVERIGALLLKSEYVFHFDKNDKDARKLVRDLGVPNFFRCPHGQKMVLKLSIMDEKALTFSARFSCVDDKDDKE